MSNGESPWVWLFQTAHLRVMTPLQNKLAYPGSRGKGEHKLIRVVMLFKDLGFFF